MTSTSHSIVEAYVAAINSQELDRIAALFTPDARLVHPLGTFVGIDEVAAFYRDVVLAGRAVIAAGDVLADGGLVMAEIAAHSPLDPEAGTAHTVDVFRLAEGGRILVLEIYYR